MKNENLNRLSGISYPFTKIPPFYLLWLFHAFKCLGESHQISKNVNNGDAKQMLFKI